MDSLKHRVLLTDVSTARSTNTALELCSLVGDDIAVEVGKKHYLEVAATLLVNKLCGAKKAKVEDRPGVTLNKQWVTTNAGIDLLDTPGVLWPKFEDARTGESLALTGAIRDAILDIETMAGILCLRLLEVAPTAFCTRYKLGDPAPLSDLKGHELLALVGRKRGYLISGGEIDTERAATMLLDEFRGGKIGRISLEIPGESADKGADTDADT